VDKAKKDRKKVSYLKEMLTDQRNVYAALSSVAAGTLLSIPFGLGAGLLPVLGYAAGTTIAALFVPGSDKFRRKVDRRRALEQREATRGHLIEEIEKRVGSEHALWGVYRRMLDRRDALRKVAGERESALQDEDVDRLDDATVDFLGLWLGRIAIQERNESFGERELTRRIEQIERQLEGIKDEADRRRLLKAKAELEALVRRRQEMRTRDAAAEAQMLSMADTFDEVYQRVMANPTSSENVSVELQSAVERMNIEEELDYIIQEEVDTMLTTPGRRSEGGT